MSGLKIVWIVLWFNCRIGTDFYFFGPSRCMQRAEYDIGKQAVQRFSLPPEDRAILELVEWLDTTFTRASVCHRFAFVYLSS